jgi:hypothetical protein
VGPLARRRAQGLDRQAGRDTLASLPSGQLPADPSSARCRGPGRKELLQCSTASPHTSRPRSGISRPARRVTIGAAAAIPVLFIAVPGSAHTDAPRDSGLIACKYPLSTQHVPAADYPKIRAQFAGSRWPDLRTAGTAYVDLAVALRTARYTDGYETVWFYQRLSAACAKHGQLPPTATAATFTPPPTPTMATVQQTQTGMLSLCMPTLKILQSHRKWRGTTAPKMSPAVGQEPLRSRLAASLAVRKRRQSSQPIHRRAVGF